MPSNEVKKAEIDGFTGFNERVGGGDGGDGTGR
jgi:hypothetical protein